MSVKLEKIRIGTRGSPLALRQTEMVRAELARVRPDMATEVVIIKTSGDWTPEQGEQPLDRKGGGKALFAKEIEEQLLAGKIDAAVHSMKDMDSNIPAGLVIDCMLPREDVRDAVILREENPAIQSLNDLPENAVIGTCSVRRQGFLLAKRPDLKIETIRGNVGTRLEKLQAGKMAGILLAKAGLNRLNMAKKSSFLLPVEEMIPCGGQGAIGIEIKQKSIDILAVFSQINCIETILRVKCERAALAELGGSCHTPIGCYAEFVDGNLWLRACLVAPDGTQKYAEEGQLKIDITEVKKQVGVSIKTDANLEAQREAIKMVESLGREVGARLKKTRAEGIALMSAERKNLVLITRPVADAEDFARDINGLGLDVLIEPMMGIINLDYDIPDLGDSTGLIFTSANGVRAFGCPADHRDIPVFAVGSHTAQEARRAGFTKIFSADGDANDLGALIRKKAIPNGKTLWHIRGEHVTAPLEEILKKDKINVEPLVIYTAKTEDNFTPNCLKAIKNGSVRTITFFSKRTAENFIRLAEKERILASLSGIRALCISPAVLECVRNASWAEAYSAERPDRAAMLKLLRTVCVQTN